MKRSETTPESGRAKLLYGAKAIAGYIFGCDDIQHERRARKLIRDGHIPTFKSGANVVAKASEVDAAIERMGVE